VFISFTELLRSRVAGKYLLKQVVRAGEDGLLFRAEMPDDTPVLVHLASAGSAASASWPAIVEVSAALQHPHLLRYLECGQSSINNRAYDYLVTEAIEDRVEDVLTERSLTADETHAVLRVALSALGHLHQKGYAHGGIGPAAIVAASGEIKLLAATVRPLPADEPGAKDSIAADFRALGETATTLLARQSGPGAMATLASPFAEFVRATATTDSSSIPAAAQLQDVLDRKRVVSRIPKPESETVVSRATLPNGSAAPGAQRAVTKSMRPILIILGTLLAVLGLTLLVSLSRRSAPAPSVNPARSAPAPPLETRAKSRPAAPPAPSADSVERQAVWAVVAATYAQYGAAAKRAAQLASDLKGLKPVVLPPEGQGKRYFVILGTAGSRREAERLRSQARGERIPEDTYVTRLQF
jgi:hypothetical protein